MLDEQVEGSTDGHCSCIILAIFRSPALVFVSIPVFAVSRHFYMPIYHTLILARLLNAKSKCSFFPTIFANGEKREKKDVQE